MNFIYSALAIKETRLEQFEVVVCPLDSVTAKFNSTYDKTVLAYKNTNDLLENLSLTIPIIFCYCRNNVGQWLTDDPFKILAQYPVVILLCLR